MKGRTVVMILLGAAFLGVLGLCGLTALGTYRWARASGIANLEVRNDLVSAQVTETQTFQASTAALLEIDTASGDIWVTADPGTKDITMKITRVGWGASEAQAAAAAEKLVVNQSQEGDHVLASFELNEPNQLTFGTYRLPQVNFEVLVPPEMAVALRSSNGSLNVAGVQGKVSLEAVFGLITVKDVAGELAVDGSNSSLDIRGVDAGGSAVVIATNFGEIKAQQIAAGTLTLRNENGEVTLTDIKTTGKLQAASSFARIQLVDVTCAGLEVNNQNGSISVTNGTVMGNVQAETSFDSIDLEQVNADGYLIKNQNGQITLNGAQGEVSLDTSFADIVVTNAQDVRLSLTNQNGNVSFSGALKEDEDHSIETSFGDILVSIPGTTAANLEISTSFGEIQSELPLTMSGKISDDSWVGKINAGGKLLKILNQNGSVKITELK